ncbi:MAG: hypothetical protein HYX91_05400 [Chloroflexi bacterium]|nr:hypothetical protein [Chloroflexota bacterium]
MAEWHGWAGKVLDIDLSKGEITRKELSRDTCEKYLGGSAYAAKVLFDELEPGIDPLGPDNIIMITQGPLSATQAPACARWDVITKGPQTGLFLRCDGGGYFGPEMRRTGHDLMIIRGQSRTPVYIWLNDDKVEIRDASHLWGKGTWETEDRLKEELGDSKLRSIKIGPSGENLGISSCVIADTSRAAAKGGVGAVWGSKKLKAIAARGSKPVKMARPDEFRRLCQEMKQRIKSDPIYPILSKYGTPAPFADSIMGRGGVPGADDAPPVLLSTEFARDVWDKSMACFNCPIHCSHWYSVKEGKYKGDCGEGFEANSILFGTLMLGIENRGWTCKYTSVCNDLGMHIDHPGYAIAWAMQLYEDGIITKEDTDGIEVTWGNEEAALQLMYKMANREGFGDILDGYPRVAAQKLGRGSERYTEHVKGMSSRGPGVEGSIEWALGLAVATRGRDHLTGAPEWCWHSTLKDPKVIQAIADYGQNHYGDPRLTADHWYFSLGKSRLVYDTENIFAICDSTGVCKFASEQCSFTNGYHMEDFAAFLSAATGHGFTAEDLDKIGERKMLVERAFNAREGIRRVDDYPAVWRWEIQNGEPHPKYRDRKFQLSLEQFNQLLDEYYRLRGCDKETGIPTRERMESLGMNDVAADLSKRGII